MVIKNKQNKWMYIVENGYDIKNILLLLCYNGFWKMFKSIVALSTHCELRVHLVESILIFITKK